MKKINKKLMIILLSGFVLMTGCKGGNTENKVSKATNESTTISDKGVINNEKEQVKEETKQPINNEQTPDQEIKNYVNDINNSIDKESIKENAIKKFIILTDFIFYDTEINGIKFNDLKEETKKEILDLYSIIDNKIESKFPDYKVNIAEKYDIASDYIKDKYIDISNSLKGKIIEKIGEDTYNNIDETNKEIIEQDKENLEVIKDKVGETTDKAKTKVKSWYEDLKNKY